MILYMNKDFTDSVYQIVRMIPQGRVTTYGAIAKCLGMGKSSRMVGMVLKNCSNEKNTVPAHRVVNRNGLLTGKAAFGSGNEMEILLDSEGVVVKDDKVLDFKTLFWDPFLEIFLE